jgi:hypothetical protein
MKGENTQITEHNAANGNDTKYTMLQIQKQKVELERRNADYIVSHIRW